MTLYSALDKDSWQMQAFEALKDLGAEIAESVDEREDWVSIPVGHAHAVEIEKISLFFHVTEMKWDRTGGVSFDRVHGNSIRLAPMIELARERCARIKAEQDKLEAEMGPGE